MKDKRCDGWWSRDGGQRRGKGPPVNGGGGEVPRTEAASVRISIKGGGRNVGRLVMRSSASAGPSSRDGGGADGRRMDEESQGWANEERRKKKKGPGRRIRRGSATRPTGGGVLMTDGAGGKFERREGRLTGWGNEEREKKDLNFCEEKKIEAGGEVSTLKLCPNQLGFKV